MNTNSAILRHTILSFTLFLACYAHQAQAHEFWIEPQEFHLESGAKIVASLKNGENFRGTQFSFLPKKFQRFELYDQTQTRSVNSRLGDLPAVNEQPKKDGLQVISYESTEHILRYDSFSKFETFAHNQDLAWILESHRNRKLPTENITEEYVRYAKALVASGTAEGQDRNFGMTLELVALTNPYTREKNGNTLVPIKYQLLHQQLPVADTRIDLFHKTDDQTVILSHYRTNADGVVTIPAIQPGHYLLNAVLATETSTRERFQTGVLWKTLWASSTFGVAAP